MHLSPRSLFTRVRAGLCVLTVTLGLAVAPGLVAPASAETAPPVTVTDECAAAKAVLAETRRQQRAAHAAAVAAQKLIRKAAAAGSSAKVDQARAALAKAQARKAVVAGLLKPRVARVSYACAAADSAVRARATGMKLGLLALADGLDLTALDATELTAVLEQLFPGVTEHLDPTRLASLVSGFNAVSAITQTQALTLLSGFLTPTEITAVLGGTASPEALAELAGNVVSQLSGLAGGIEVPAELDLETLWTVLGGLLAGLDLGPLCALVPIPLLCS